MSQKDLHDDKNNVIDQLPDVEIDNKEFLETQAKLLIIDRKQGIKIYIK